MRSVCNRSFRKGANDVAITTGGPAFGGKLRVTQASVPPTLTSVLADYTAAVASYSGYAEVTQTYGLSGSQNDGSTRGKGLASRFGIAGGSTFQTLYNVYLTNSAGNLLIGAAAFPDPPVLGTSTSTTWPTPNLPWGPPSPNPPFGLDLLITSHVQRLHLDLLSVALGLLDGATVHLLQQAVNLTQDTTIADLVAAEADYSGYAAQVVAAWLAAFTGEDGYGLLQMASQLFAPNASVVSNEIFGLWVSNAADDDWSYAMLLDQSVTLDGPDTGLVVSAPLTWGT